ncbi:MAG: 30S ribosomal protein S4 [Patescibacteria group bacterium]
MLREQVCKKCRRAGEKLFLKGERCNSPKCAMVKRNYPPGIHGQKGYSRMSGFAVHLKEKQKIRYIYGLTETQLANYMRKALKKKGNTSELFLQSLERRFDNIVFRLGFARSRAEARKTITHGHFLINDKKVNIPSYLLRPKDKITLAAKSAKNKLFSEILKSADKQKTADWLSFDKTSHQGEVLHLPTQKDLNLGFQTQLVVEFYSNG